MRKWTASKVSLPIALIFGAAGSLLPTQSNAQTPDLMRLPGVINLGATTFLDGFLPTTPGCTFVQYLRYNFWDAINDKNGNSIPAFKDPEINAVAPVSQVLCATPVKILGGTFGIGGLLPFAGFDNSFDPHGLALLDNGFGLADIALEPYIQMPPVIQNGRAVYSQRFELTVFAPTGKFDERKDLNQSSGYWSLNPYWAATWLPDPKWELSWRLHYMYNFETSKIGTSLVPDAQDIFRNGQAGQFAWVNFTLGYAVNDKFRLGLNGYYLLQLTDDELNGRSYSGGKEESLYLGPGFHVQLDAKTGINFNVFLPIEDKNRLSGGSQYNLVFGHTF